MLFSRLGGVDVFLVPDGQLPWDDDDEALWQLSPATPFPNELLVEPIHNTRVAKIQPVLTTHYEQFRKVCLTNKLNCLKITDHVSCMKTQSIETRVKVIKTRKMPKVIFKSLF